MCRAAELSELLRKGLYVTSLAKSLSTQVEGKSLPQVRTRQCTLTSDGKVVCKDCVITPDTRTGATPCALAASMEARFFRELCWLHGGMPPATRHTATPICTLALVLAALDSPVSERFTPRELEG